MATKETLVRDRLVSQLKELDLSTYEAAIYLTLLSHAKITASTLCKETGIPDSKIYFALNGLATKGMLVTQKSNPSLYHAVPPREAVANLKRQMTDRLNERLLAADVLAETLTPIYESTERPEELVVAYLIHGQKNIITRMKTLIDTAREEVTLFLSYPALLKALKPALLDASRKRRLQLNIAITQRTLETEDCADLPGIRLLCCSIDPIGMLIADKTTLLTLTNWSDEVATLTQDRSLIQVIRGYYDSPTCCTIIPQRR
jgi:sugar-specific transcriptional regulator TrmB